MPNVDRNRLWLVLTAALGAVVLDQATKGLILEIVMQPPRVIRVTPFLSLTLGFNTGVSFGLFRDALEDVPWLLAGAKVLISAALIAWALIAAHRMEALGLSLMAGGALGNVMDRARHGAVTDFLHLHAAGWHWPTFNMADVAITLGAALLIGAGLFAKPSTAEPAPNALSGGPLP